MKYTAEGKNYVTMYVLSAVDLISFMRDKALKVCSVAFADDSPP